MKNIALLVILAFLIGEITFAQIQPRTRNDKSTGDWQEINSSQGNFWALFPGKADYQSTPVSTEIGNITMHNYLLDNGDVAYFIAYSDYPENLVKQSDPNTLLESVKDGALKKFDTKNVISEEKIEINGYPAIMSHVKGNMKGMQVTFKGFQLLADSRLYQVYLLSTGVFDNKTADKFINSFVINKSGWVNKMGDNGSFRFSLPGEPEFMSKPTSTAVGEIMFNAYSYSDGNVAWYVSYSDFPAAHIQGNDPAALLENAFGGATGKLTTKNVLYKTKSKIDGHEALKIDVTGVMQGMNVRYRGFYALVDNRLYQVYCLAIGDNYDKQKANYFEESFKLIRP